MDNFVNVWQFNEENPGPKYSYIIINSNINMDSQTFDDGGVENWKYKTRKWKKKL